MAGKCSVHPGRDSVVERFRKKYCQKCKDAQDKALTQVDRHVEPKACFIVYDGGDAWRALTGTGCAHWVAHEKNITVGGSSARCLDGYTIRVRDLHRHVESHEITVRGEVQVGDIWISLRGSDWTDPDHCGIVSRVIQPPTNATNPPQIMIKHDSSRQGRVSEDDFDVRFSAKGRFYRLP